jgi:hypothetical protein
MFEKIKYKIEKKVIDWVIKKHFAYYKTYFIVDGNNKIIENGGTINDDGDTVYDDALFPIIKNKNGEIMYSEFIQYFKINAKNK